MGDPFSSPIKGLFKLSHKLTGQLQHAISAKIARALDAHPNLRGLYTYRDPRFVSKARDLASHNGYQAWHRQLDREIVDWIENNPGATANEFEEHLHWRYAQPDLRERFPLGLRNESFFDK